jgi:endonuclease YncB( thermonuclease family)
VTNTEWSWPNSQITRVIDGDTFVARLTKDIGFHGLVAFEQKLRLNRINAPKYSASHPDQTVDGTRARDYFQTLVNNRSDLMIETVKPYKYGDEWMAEVALTTIAIGTSPSQWDNVSDLLVAAGHAVYWDGSGVRPSDT